MQWRCDFGPPLWSSRKCVQDGWSDSIARATETARKAPTVRRRRHRLLALLAVTLGLATLTAAAGHLAPVSLRYGIWTWTPGEDAPRMPFHGREYLRGRPYPALPADVQRLADGPGGSGIYSQPPITGYAPTDVYLRYPDGHAIGYALSGGP